jgi:hypothetical protein
MVAYPNITPALGLLLVAGDTRGILLSSPKDLVQSAIFVADGSVNIADGAKD